MIDYRDPLYTFVWVLPSLFPVAAGVVYHLPPYITWVPFLTAAFFAYLFPKIEPGPTVSRFGRNLLFMLVLFSIFLFTGFSIRASGLPNKVLTLTVMLGMLLCGVSARLYFIIHIRTFTSTTRSFLPLVMLILGEATYVGAWFVLTWYLSPHPPSMDGSILLDWIQTPFFWLYWLILQGSIGLQFVQALSPKTPEGRKLLQRGIFYLTVLLIPGGVLVLFLTHTPLKWLMYGLLWIYTWKTAERIIAFLHTVEEDHDRFSDQHWSELKHRWVRQTLYYTLFALLFLISYAVEIRTL